MKSKNNEIILNFEDVLNTYKSSPHGLIALSKYKFWFPIIKSTVLAGIVADLIGDGHLQDYPKLRLDYTSKSKKELKRFNNEVYQLFKLNGKIRECKTNKYGTYNLGVNNKPLARSLILLGVPSGAKVFSNFNIPRWIIEDKQLFARFINRLFSCEGCVDVPSKCIELKMYKSVSLIKGGIDFFNEIKIHLEKYFQIKSTNPFLTGKNNIRKDGRETKGIRIKIKNKESLINFHKFIGFDDNKKQKKLEKII
jgi:hypothetical protein